MRLNEMSFLPRLVCIGRKCAACVGRWNIIEGESRHCGLMI